MRLMTNRVVRVLAVAFTMCAAPAFAQEKRIEVSVLAGWAFSEGVDGDPVIGGDGNVYDRIDPKSSFKWGLSAGVLASDGAEVGFWFGRQLSTLQASGTNTVDVGDMTIDNYHSYFAYNFFDHTDAIRPYIFLGCGATHYSGVDFTRRNGQPGTIGGETRFSTTWGAGVKYHSSPNVGVQFGGQWTPTYIKSDAVGCWCDPFWGCYVVGNTQYSHQFDLNGGVTFRF